MDPVPDLDKPCGSPMEVEAETAQPNYPPKSKDSQSNSQSGEQSESKEEAKEVEEGALKPEGSELDITGMPGMGKMIVAAIPPHQQARQEALDRELEELAAERNAVPAILQDQPSPEEPQEENPEEEKEDPAPAGTASGSSSDVKEEQERNAPHQPEDIEKPETPEPQAAAPASSAESSRAHSPTEPQDK